MHKTPRGSEPDLSHWCIIPIPALLYRYCALYCIMPAPALAVSISTVEYNSVFTALYRDPRALWLLYCKVLYGCGVRCAL
jgi:hypothetical protein